MTPAGDAAALVRRVVARTRAQRAALGPYAATVYERQTVRGASGAVASVTETALEAYGAPGGGWREVIVAERRTANLERAGGAGLASVTRGVLTPSPVELGLLDLELVDLLAADVEIGGHRLVGPTHPDALDVYEFEIVGRRSLEGRTVVEVALQPRSRTASAFRGTLLVLEATADVLEADLSPGPAFQYPPPIAVEEARFRQHYAPVTADSSAWLPTDFQAKVAVALRYGGLLTVGPLAVESVAQISGYRLGVEAPDTPGDSYSAQYPAAPTAARLPEDLATIPLGPDEAAAYAAGDSLAPVAYALRFRGILAPVARGAVMGAAAAEAVAPEDERTFRAALFPLIAITPVEGLRIGAVELIQVGPLVLTPSAAFRTADGGISLAFGASTPVFERGPAGRALRLSAIGDAADDVARRAPPFAPDLLAAVGARGGYYARQRAAAGLVLERGGLGTIRFGGADLGVSAEASAQLLVETASTYKADLRPGGVPTPQLDVDLLTFGPGRASVTTRSVVARGGVGTLALPLGLVPRQAVQVAVEMGEWAGEGAFWSAETAVDVAVRTFALRRAVGPALYVRLGAGAAGGRLPLTRTLSVGGSLGDGGALGEGGFLGAAFTQFGQLRSWTGGPYEGDRYTAAYWEHTFGTLPFEALGLNTLVRNGYGLLVYGAHARTWLAADRAAEYIAAGYPAGASDGWHHEVGVSLTGILGLLRVDLTQRVNAPGTVLGVGFARQL